MFLSQVDLTTALRPSLLPDETLLFVQDTVGLYEGKVKVDGYQSGHVYLTTHRVCYIDNEEPRRKAVAVNLKDVDRCEFYAGFLKSSAKVTVYAKSSSLGSSKTRPSISNQSNIESTSSASRHASFVNSPAPATTNATWICPICSFSNPVPSNFDPVLANDNTPLPPCLTCGIKPPLANVVKAAIASMSNRVSTNITLGNSLSHLNSSNPPHNQFATSDDHASSVCPRCTFQNDASLLSCEMCGAPLANATHNNTNTSAIGRRDSPGFTSNGFNLLFDTTDSVKFAFRGGGEKLFHERLKTALIQRKWLLYSAPAAPKQGSSRTSNDQKVSSSPKTANIGITGLERRGTEIRKNNEMVIGNAFEDLAALMASAKEIIALAEQFATQARSANGDPTAASAYGSSISEYQALLAQMNLSTTKEMLAPNGNSSTNSNSLYLTELSRQLAEYLTDDRTGILRSEGGIISLVDLWAVFNAARRGMELVSPTDFSAAVSLFEKLQLPVRLRRFKSGLLVVQGIDRTDAKTIKAILGWLRLLRETTLRSIDDEKNAREEIQWGRGVTALETADRFGWSVGVATEELEMAEEKGALCREVGLEGIKFWENWLMSSEADMQDPNLAQIESSF